MATAMAETLPINSVIHQPGCACSVQRSFKCRQIFTYSCDGDNLFKPDESELRYLCMPDDPDDVLFDLKDNFEAYIERDRSVETIERILKCLQHLEGRGPKDEGKKKGTGREGSEGVEEGGDGEDLADKMSGLTLDKYKTEMVYSRVSSLALDPNNPLVVCRRGLFRDLMSTPYLLQSKNKDGLSVTAVKHGDKIYLMKSSKQDESWGSEEEIRLNSYTGSKFEQFVSKRTPDGPSIAESNEIVDTRKGFYTLTEGKVGKHTLLYGGEVDCLDLEDKGPDRAYVQFKTTKPLQEPPKYFQSLKLMKWWAQSHMVGIKKIVCGIKDHDAIVYQLKTYRVDQLQQICNHQWSPCVCFTFLDNFLTYVKRVLRDEENNPRPKTEIVCRRGLLSKIMILPYLVNQPKKHDVSITAIKYKNRIFLSTSGGGFKNYTAFNNIDDCKYNYTGHKFEQYVTKETLNSSVSLAKKGEPVNLWEAHYTCVRAKIGDNTLVYSGEVDCCDPRSDKAKYVECKTYYKVFHQDCLPNHRESFHMLKWWSQSVLVGVNMILCGVRKGDRVTLLHPYRLADLPGICKGQWEPEVCFSFLDKFLDFVQTSLADKPDDHRIVHRFYSNLTGRKSSGKSGIRYEVLADGSGAGFLPEWFCA